MSSDDIDRRTFLKTTAAGGALVTLGVSVPGCGNPVEPAPLARVTTIEALSATEATISNNALNSDTYGVIFVPWQIYKDLQPIGGAITLQLGADIVSSDETGYAVPPDNTVLLVHVGDGAFLATQSSCPHQGCPLGFAEGLIECPCHASRFYADSANGHCAGDVEHLPAAAPLQVYRTDVKKMMVGTAGVLEIVTIDLKTAAPCGSQPTVPPVVNGSVTFPFADFPELTMTGGAVVGQPMGATAPLLVIRLSATTVSALNARCTHRGCTVSWSPAQGRIVCPCHGSTFASDGGMPTAPATRPLSSYPAVLNADSIVVTVT